MSRRYLVDGREPQWATEPWAQSILTGDDAERAREAYARAGARVNRPKVLAAEADWLAAVMPVVLTAIPVKNKPADQADQGEDQSGPVSTIWATDAVGVARRCLRAWLTDTGPRPGRTVAKADRKWLRATLAQVRTALGISGPECGCGDCPCETADQCAGNGDNGEECDCCSYYCSGTACEDEYCRGCGLCKRDRVPDALADWADAAYRLVEESSIGVLPADDGLKVKGDDDHLQLGPLPANERLDAQWRPPVGELVQAGPVTGRRVTSADKDAARVTSVVDRGLSSSSASRARGLVTSGALQDLERVTDETHVRYQVRTRGSMPEPYVTTVTWPAVEELRTLRGLHSVIPACSCPMGSPGRWCKHSAALLYVMHDRRPGSRPRRLLPA